jgi:hypothetical protein
MTTRIHDPAEPGDLRPAVPNGPATARRLTRVLAGLVVTGVLVQAVLAGGFLAGRPALRDLHEQLGYGLFIAAVLLLGVGLAARRQQPPATAALPTRAALVLTLAAAVFAGMRASRGSPDLLMLHIPLAFAIVALATRLLLLTFRAASHTVDQADSDRPAAQDGPDG